MAGLSPRLTPSAFPGAARLGLWGSGAARGKGLAARNRRGVSGSRPKPEPREGFTDLLPPGVSRSRLEAKRYILSPKLAETMVPFLLRNDGCGLIVEINPGEPCGVDGALSGAAGRVCTHLPSPPARAAG